MSTIQAIATLVSALLIPWLVQLIKTKTMSSEVARWVALAVSLVAGVLTGLAAGIPATAGDWVTCVLAVVGGIQVAYSAFKAVGVTNAWLDALLNIGSVDGKHTVAAVADDTTADVEPVIEVTDEPTPVAEAETLQNAVG